MVIVIVFNATLIIFQYRGGEFSFMGKTGAPGEGHIPVASHRQTLSHNVVSSSPHLNRIRTHTGSDDRH